MTPYAVTSYPCMGLTFLFTYARFQPRGSRAGPYCMTLCAVTSHACMVLTFSFTHARPGVQLISGWFSWSGHSWYLGAASWMIGPRGHMPRNDTTFPDSFARPCLLIGPCGAAHWILIFLCNITNKGTIITIEQLWGWTQPPPPVCVKWTSRWLLVGKSAGWPYGDYGQFDRPYAAM